MPAVSSPLTPPVGEGEETADMSDYINVKGALPRQFCCILGKTAQIFDKEHVL